MGSAELSYIDENDFDISGIEPLECSMAAGPTTSSVSSITSDGGAPCPTGSVFHKERMTVPQIITTDCDIAPDHEEEELIWYQLPTTVIGIKGWE